MAGNREVYRVPAQQVMPPFGLIEHRFIIGLISFCLISGGLDLARVRSSNKRNLLRKSFESQTGKSTLLWRIVHAKSRIDLCREPASRGMLLLFLHTCGSRRGFSSPINSYTSSLES